MKNFKAFKTLTEAVKLTPAELNKDNSITKEPRIDILIRLIQQGKPVELAKGGSVTIEKTDELLKLLIDFKKNQSNKKFAIPFMGIDGKNYNIGKTMGGNDVKLLVRGAPATGDESTNLNDLSSDESEGKDDNKNNKGNSSSNFKDFSAIS